MKLYFWQDWLSRLLIVTVSVVGLVTARPALSQEWSRPDVARTVTVPEPWPHSPSARMGSRSNGITVSPLKTAQSSFHQPTSPNLPIVSPGQTNPPPVLRWSIGSASPGSFNAPRPFPSVQPQPWANRSPGFSEPPRSPVLAEPQYTQPADVPAQYHNATWSQRPSGNKVQWPEFSTQPSRTSVGRPAAAESQQPVVLVKFAEQEAAAIDSAHNEVTPRSRVTASTGREPPTKPLSKIQRVNGESRLNHEDAGAIPAESLIAPFAERAQSYPDKMPLPIQPGQLVELPRDFTPWWDEAINRPVRANTSSLNVDAESLVLKAIEHSPQIIAMRVDPVIRETVILEESANFDWVSFLDTTYDDKSDPIGSTLTAGPGKTRYRDNHLQSTAGLRKKLDRGGKFDITQRFGYQDTNSAFFVPANQGTSRVELNFTQPLLRGSGETVSQSRVVLASLDHEVASADLLVNMQDHLVAVYESYWTLYRARANRLQKNRLLQRAIATERMLEGRQGVDSIQRQVLRAQAAVASRRAEIVRCETAIRNAESRLRLLVNSPELKDRTQLELLPSELPLSDELEVTLRGSVESALEHRPDIFSAIQRMKAESLRLEVAKNELLPKLDLALGTYVAGLRGNGQIGKAYADQFSEGQPGYNIGLMFEMPLGNRAAKARQSRRQWELAKALKEFEASVETAMTEVEVAVRETETSYQEMLGHFQAMVASENEAQYLDERWKLLPGNDQTISFLLEDLLDAQERVANEEADFVASQVAYVLAVVNLKRATGILLTVDQSGAAQTAPVPNPNQITQPTPQANSVPPAPGPLRLPE